MSVIVCQGEIMQNKVHLIDNMEFMKNKPDNYYDLAIVDPPYFDGPNKLGYYGGRQSKTGVYRGEYKKIGSWKVPDYNFYYELKRVSKEQIIWGINYFVFAGEIRGRIIWDKINDQALFSKCEIASCSMIETVQQFRYMWNGMLQGKSITEGHIVQGNKKKNEKRIHATQKPVILYKWQLKNYAKPGFKILDTHVGSGSIRIACYDMGFDFEGCEIDADCWQAQEDRFKRHTQQNDLFGKEEIQELIFK